MVIEYVGQLVRTSLCDQREIYYNSKNIGCYMFKVDDVVAVDATLTGGPARLDILIYNITYLSYLRWFPRLTSSFHAL